MTLLLALASQVFLSGLALFRLGQPTPALAATCVATTNGNWSTPGTWTGCGSTYPGAGSGDIVTINAGVFVTLDITPANSISTLTLSQPGATSSALNFNPGTALTATGAVTINDSTGAGTATIAVGSGTLTANSIAIVGGATAASTLSVSTGTISTTGGGAISFSGTEANARLTSTGASTIRVSGHFDLSPGTFTAGSSTLEMNGTGTFTSDGETINNFTTSGAGTVTLANAIHTIAGNLTLGSAGLTGGTSTVRMTGTGKTIAGGNLTLANLTVEGSATLQTSNLLVSGTTQVDGTLALINLLYVQTLTLNGTISDAGGILLYYSATPFPTSGTLTADLYMVVDANDQTLSSRTYGGYVKAFNQTTTDRTLTLAAGDINITGGILDVSNNNTGKVTIDGETNDPTLQATGIGSTLQAGGAEKRTIKPGANIWTISGNVDFANITYDTTTSAGNTLVMTGTGATLTGNNQILNNFIISGTVTLQTSAVTVAGTAQIDSGKQLTIDRTVGDVYLAHTGAILTLNGTITGINDGNYRYSSTLPFPTSGTINATLLMMATNNDQTLSARIYGGRVQLYNSSPTTARTVTLASGPHTYSNNFEVAAVDAANLTVDASANPTVNITGDLDFVGLGNGTESITSGTGMWTVSGNVNFTDGTYTATAGNTLIMNGTGGKTIAGNNQTLYNLTVDPASAGTITMTTSNLNVSNTLSIATGDTLSVGAFELIHTGATLTLNGTLTGAGNYYYYSATPFPTTGTISVGNLYMTTTSNDQTLSARTYTSNVHAYNSGVTNRNLILGAGPPDITITGIFYLLATGAGTITVTGVANNPNLNAGSLLKNGAGGVAHTYATGTGIWTISGDVNLTGMTYTATVGNTLVMNGTVARTLTTNNQSFDRLTLNNTGTTGANDNVTVSGNLDVNSTLNITDGDLVLSTNDPNVTSGGDVTIGASAFVTKADNGTATWTFDGTGTSTWTDNASGQDLGLVTIDGTTKTVNLGSSVKATKVTVTDTLGLASSGYTLTLTGSGQGGSQPLTVTGTLNEGTNSTVEFTGTTATDIERETYWNLSVKPGANGITHHAEGGGTLTVLGNLTVGNGTNTGTLNLDTNDPTVDINGQVTIAASGTLTASATGTFTVGGNWDNNGTFTHSSGTLTLDATDADNTVEAGSSNYNHLTFSGAGGGNGTWTVQTDDATVAGTLNINTGDTLSVGTGRGLTHTGATLTLNGTLSGAGNYYYYSSTAFPTTGVVMVDNLYMTSTNNDQTLSARTYTGNVYAYNAGATPRNLFLGSGNVDIGGTLYVLAQGTGSITVDGSANNPNPAVYTGGLSKSGSGSAAHTYISGTGTWTVSASINLTGVTYTATPNNTLNMNNEGTLTTAGNILQNFITSGSDPITFANENHTIAGDLMLGPSATINAGTSTLTLSGLSKTIDGGGQTLNNLVIDPPSSSTTTFAAGSSLTVAGLWTVAGASGKVVTLQSSGASQWNINPAQASVSYASVSGSNNHGSTICAQFSLNGGNNTNWQFNSSNTCTNPSIADNQSGDTTPRSSAGTTYDIDFSQSLTGPQLDYGQYIAYSGSNRSGTLLKDWTNIFADNTHTYTTNWPVDFSALPDGVSYVSVRTVDTDGITTESTDVFSVLKDTVVPTGTVAYSTIATTTGSVTATLTTSEPTTVTNNSGSATYTFTANGTFTFTFQDAAGNTGSATATVSNITPPSTAVTPTFSGIRVLVSSSSVVISWKTSVASTSLLRLGRTTKYGTTTSSTKKEIWHVATIKGLRSNTTYRYQLEGTATATGRTVDAGFKTLAKPQLTIVVAPTISTAFLKQGKHDILRLIVKGKGGQTVRVYLDGKRYRQLTVPGNRGKTRSFNVYLELSKIKIGKHSVYLRTVDQLGRQSAIIQKVNFQSKRSGSRYLMTSESINIAEQLGISPKRNPLMN